MKLRTVLGGAAAALLALTLTSCTDADVASQNLSKDADNFKVLRRVVFVNGITDKYLLSIEGYCSIKHDGGGESPGGGQGQLEVTCKVGEGQYKKHFLGLSDNVTYFAEQMESKGVSTSHYKVILKPSVIAPEIEGR